MKIQQGDVVLHGLDPDALSGMVNNNKEINRVRRLRGVTHLPSAPTNLVTRTGDMAKTLALGEVTGHHHSAVMDHPDTHPEATFEIKELGDRIFVEVKGGNVIVTHQEHGPICVPPGLYERRITREIDHMTGLATGTTVTRFVAD